MSFFYKMYKSAIKFSLIKNRVLLIKQKNFSPAQKMLEKFGKSWVSFIYLNGLSHIID